MKLSILAAGLLAFGAAGSGLAQSADKLPKFDAASMKPGKPETHSFQLTPGRMTWIGCPLEGLIQYAFRAPRYQLSGGPKWWESEFYDIVATMPADTSQPALRLMVQDLPVFVLRQSATGPKFQIEKREKRDGDGQLGGGAPGRVGGIKVSALDLAEVLSGYLDRPVLDETGIDGLFDFKLIWSPDETSRQLNPAEQHAPADPNGVSIFAAIQEQLGLRLVPQKGSIDMLVIDHVDRIPSDN